MATVATRSVGSGTHADGRCSQRRPRRDRRPEGRSRRKRDRLLGDVGEIGDRFSSDLAR